jgi:beta-xylosidase
MSVDAKNGDGWLFASFRGNGEDGLHLAWSRDGLKWTAFGDDRSFLKPEVGGKLMRDPCIVRGPDGVFHMVWTSSWTDRGIGIAHSPDLVNWSRQEFVPVMEHEKTARNCWAPEITWDPDGGEYVIYWATTIPGRFTETEASADKGWNHRLYCTTTRDFKTYTDTRLFHDPGFNSIDATIVKADGNWVMVLKDETLTPPAKNLRIATSAKLSGPWSAAAPPFSPAGLWVEGPTCARIGDAWHVYFDKYRDGGYGAMKTRDFKNWEDVTAQLVYPKGLRHGTVVAVTGDILDSLLKLDATIQKEIKKSLEH